MKLKLPIAIALAVLLTVGLWQWVHHQPLAQPVATRVKLQVAPPPKPVPASAPKMATVTGKPAGIPAQVLSPATSAWSAVQKIVDTRAGYEERMTAVNSLSSHLTDDDWAVLKSFLLKPDTQDKDQWGQVVKNRLMDMLCAQKPPPAGLGDVLAQMYSDHQQDNVLRDYAVQHLTAYYEQMASQGDSAWRGWDVQSVLWEAVNETSDSIGGTALLALKRLSQEYPGFDRERIAATALQMAENSAVSELTHITAFQVCAQMGTMDALPVVQQAAQNGETISVKMSAIAALGQLGGPEQIPFLNSVLAGAEDRLKPAAQKALEQITNRQGQMASDK